MKIPVFHATSPENAERIQREGFSISRESEEWFQGRGVYFASDPDVAATYGTVILETELDTDDFLETKRPLDTFYKFYNRRKDQMTKETAWVEYLRLAEERRKRALALGYRGWKSGGLGGSALGGWWLEISVADPEYAKGLKVRQLPYAGIGPVEREHVRHVLLRHLPRSILVRRYRRRCR